jgi:sec-independent protein translocase protein TatA
MYANIIGPDLLIVLGVVVLLFGGSQLPKLARSLGSARREFEQGVSSPDEQATETKPPSARSA